MRLGRDLVGPVPELVVPAVPKTWSKRKGTDLAKACRELNCLGPELIGPSQSMVSVVPKKRLVPKNTRNKVNLERKKKKTVFKRQVQFAGTGGAEKEKTPNRVSFWGRIIRNKRKS